MPRDALPEPQPDAGPEPHPAAQQPLDADGDLWWTVARMAVGTVLRATFRLRFVDTANIPFAGGALLTYNHVSVLDPLPVALAAGRRGRSVRFLAVHDVFEHGFVGWAMRRTRQIPLRRGLGDWDAIGKIADVLRSGSLAGMSPEGTVGSGAALQPGQRGAARIALLAGVPVLPVGVWGTQRRWPKEGLRKTLERPTVAVVIGRPIPPAGDARSRPDVIAFTDRIMEGIRVVADRARFRAEMR
jgi:1-acyl-sn-glycerol-3-phosphate acyltransferase